MKGANNIVENIFVANGYPRKEVKLAMRERERRGDTQAEMKNGTVCLPYIRGVSERLKKVYNKYGVRAAFRCGSQVKELGNKTKSNLGQRKNNVIYQIPCICGHIYIGQTERAVGLRHKEHEADLRLTRIDIEEDKDEEAGKRIKKSRLVEHCVNNCGLNPDWEYIKILGKDKGWTSRRLRESYHTMKRQYEGLNTINDTDIQFDISWKGLLKEYWSKKKSRKKS